MNKKIHSLTLLVNLGIYGAALPVMAEEKTDSAALTNEDTIVVTAAQQNLQAPGVSTITADEIRKNPPCLLYTSDAADEHRCRSRWSPYH